MEARRAGVRDAAEEEGLVDEGLKAEERAEKKEEVKEVDEVEEPAVDDAGIIGSIEK